MADHSTGHSTWSASATARNWQCPGALALAQTTVGQPESIHAARGTAAHEWAERCLTRGEQPADGLGVIVKTKEHEIEIDEEIVNSAAEYVGYCLKAEATAVAEGGSVKVEERFSLEKLKPPFEAGGTADFTVYYPHQKRFEVVDLKHGVGVVEAQGNVQLRTYALGAVLANPGLDIEQVTVTIVQPRAPHKNGRIRSETFHIVELLEWTAELMAAMRRSREAFDSFPGLAPSIALDEWADRWLNPGACRWCPAEGFCPKLKKRALDIAGVWFDAFDKPQLSNRPDERSPEQVAKDLDLLDLVEDWIKARRAYAHTLAEQGVEIPNYVLVDKIGNRKWAVEDASLPIRLRDDAGLTEDEIYEKRIRSVAQIEKVIGKDRKTKIEDLWLRPVVGTNLCRADKTSRPATKSAAERYFQQES